MPIELILNCARVRYADDMTPIALDLRLGEQAAYWQRESKRRAELIRRLSWDPGRRWFFEYDYTQQARLPYWGIYATWALWAGVATRRQAAGIVANMSDTH